MASAIRRATFWRDGSSQQGPFHFAEKPIRGMLVNAYGPRRPLPMLGGYRQGIGW